MNCLHLKQGLMLTFTSQEDWFGRILCVAPHEIDSVTALACCAIQNLVEAHWRCTNFKWAIRLK